MANVDASEDVTVIAREEATVVARPVRGWDEDHARRDALLLGVLALGAYWLSNDGQFMFFNYHLHLAVSFLNGRLYIANPPSWLTEFAYADGKPYVYFDPFPAVFLLPLAALWGLTVNLAKVSIVVGACNVALMRLAVGALGVQRSTANWCALLFGVGTVHFYASWYGNTWMLAHLLAVAALTLAWIEALGAANPYLLGLFCAIAATSRSPAALGTPIFFLIALHRRPRLQTAVAFAVPLLLTGLLLAVYNFARFGDFLNNGYLLANQALLNPEYGSFSWRYITRNIYQYLLRVPELSAQLAVLDAHRSRSEPARDHARGGAAVPARLERARARGEAARAARARRLRHDLRAVPLLLLGRLAAVRQPLHARLHALSHRRAGAAQRSAPGAVALAAADAGPAQHRGERLGDVVLARTAHVGQRARTTSPLRRGRACSTNRRRA